MDVSRVVTTTAGPVEVVHVPGERPPVLFFPGGHCSARSDCGWDLYTDLGYALIAFSRPGYGATRVGALAPDRFVPLVREVCRELDVAQVAAVIGVSGGGLQALHVAADQQLASPRLALHSCAPSTLPYPDSRARALGGPIAFSPLLEDLTWSMIRRMVRSDTGLRRMMAPLSKLPLDQWWGDLTVSDLADARALFQSMGSGSGFVNDLRQGRRNAAPSRLAAISRVACPTLVTASRDDAAVSFAHAEDFAARIPGAILVELGAPSHLFWIGPGRAQAASAVAEFLSE